MTPDVEARWWARVDPGDGGCWRWTGGVQARGYGRFSLPGKRHVLAHRWGYERLVGSIADGLELDHLCGHPWCVNPLHLEPVTHAENVRRGRVAYVNARRGQAVTHCRRGHPFTEANTYQRLGRPGRNCRACNADSASRRRKTVTL